MRSPKNMLTPVAALVLAALPLGASDLAVVYTVTGPDGRTATTTDYYSADHFRSGDGHNEVIFDLAAGRITNVDHGRKEYSETTVAEIEAAMKAANAQMEAALKNMPPAMREKMGGLAGGPGTVQVTSGERRRKIAGYDTQLYVITIGGTRTESWNAPSLQPPFDPAEMMRLQSLTGPAARALGAGNVTAELQKIKGFPLASSSTVSVMGRTMNTSREATEVKTGPLPAGAFVIPTGYKRVDSPLTKMMQR